MRGLKFKHVSKRGPWWEQFAECPQVYDCLNGIIVDYDSLVNRVTINQGNVIAMDSTGNM